MNVKNQPAADRTIIFVVPSLACEYIGIELLSSLVQTHCRMSVRIAATQAALFRQLARAPRAFVGFSTYSAYAADYVRLAQKIKRRFPEAVCLCGGPHATFCPEMIEADGIDGVCIGEAEDALVEFFTTYDWQQRRPAAHLANWWLKLDGVVHRNAPRPPRRNLDELPLPDMRLFSNSTLYRRGVRRFMLSRGCLMQCRYCSCPGMAACYSMSAVASFRQKSVPAAVEEISQSLQRFGGRAVGFVDSIFGIDRAWLEEFAPAYARQVGLPFYCNTEASIVDPDYARRLRHAGCVFTYLGLETANDRVRRDILGKGFTTDTLRQAVRALREQRIEIGVYNMIGIPGGTLADDLDTLRVNQQLAPAIADVKVFSFYPGTALYRQYQQQGQLAQPLPVRHMVYWAVLNTPALRPDLDQLLRLQCLFSLFVRWSAPRWLIQIIIRVPALALYRAIAFLALRVMQFDYARLCSLLAQPQERKNGHESHASAGFSPKTTNA